jgi:DNA-binding LacI/PurR family transcriptional regulator
MATIRDIAKRANVSIATVSRVLNNSAAVKEAIRYSVLQAAEELNYPVENLRARPQINPAVLVLIRPNDTSGAFTGMPDRDFERMVWDGVHTVLDQRGIAARLQQSGSSGEAASQYANDPSISGLILLGGIVQSDFVTALIKNRVPFVVAGSHLRDVSVNSVMADVFHGISSAVRALIADGRRRIALVNGPAETMTSAEKLDGLLLTLNKHGLPFTPNQVVSSDFTPETGYMQTLQLLKQFPEVDAILYGDDTIALGGTKALRENMKRIPDDVAVVGFGNYRLAEYTDPPLASVQFDMRAMGRIAAQRLCMLIESPDDDPWLIRVPCTFISRQSAQRRG